jgi:hypothetical protein
VGLDGVDFDAEARGDGGEGGALREGGAGELVGRDGEAVAAEVFAVGVGRVSGDAGAGGEGDAAGALEAGVVAGVAAAGEVDLVGEGVKLVGLAG